MWLARGGGSTLFLVCWVPSVYSLFSLVSIAFCLKWISNMIPFKHVSLWGLYIGCNCVSQ